MQREARTFGMVLFLFGIGMCAVRCASVTPQQRADIEQGACAVVEAFSGLPEASAICATASELAELALMTTALRQDAGGGRRMSACKIIPTTTTCATDAELVIGIASIVEKRRSHSSTGTEVSR